MSAPRPRGLTALPSRVRIPQGHPCPRRPCSPTGSCSGTPQDRLRRRHDSFQTMASWCDARQIRIRSRACPRSLARAGQKAACFFSPESPPRVAAPPAPRRGSLPLTAASACSARNTTREILRRDRDLGSGTDLVEDVKITFPRWLRSTRVGGSHVTFSPRCSTRGEPGKRRATSREECCRSGRRRSRALRLRRNRAA